MSEKVKSLAVTISGYACCTHFLMEVQMNRHLATHLDNHRFTPGRRKKPKFINSVISNSQLIQASRKWRVVLEEEEHSLFAITLISIEIICKFLEIFTLHDLLNVVILNLLK